MNKGKLNIGIIGDVRQAFEMKCIHILVDGYREMHKQKSYDPSWEEERITAELIRYIKATSSVQEWRIHVVPEPRIYSDEVYNNTITPKEAPRIDMQFLNWSSSDELIYHIEAKNLAENDWQKPDGSHVNASYLTNRYIDTGIGNFINDRYKQGCIAGYVLQGSVPKVISRINKCITVTKKRPLETISIGKPINNYSFCYTSNHIKQVGTSFHTYHIFLELQ